MASDEFGEKTEEATEHRRREERQRGNVPRSSELNTAGHLLTNAALFWMLGATSVAALGSLIVSLLSTAHTHSGSPLDVQNQFQELASWAATNVLPWLATMVVSAVAINLAQVGFLLATEKLTPNLNALNPLTGLQRIFSIRSVVTLAISLCKLSLLMSVAFWFVHSRLPEILLLTGQPVSTAFVTIGGAIVDLSLILAAILLAIGVADFGFQKWKYEQDIMMTKEELKREFKDQDGDPLIRRRRREAHQKLVAARDISEVRNATFGLANPTHYFVAFRYEPPQYPLPIVIAKGVDDVALKMREVAEENDIPVIERPDLARRAYNTLKVGQGIPVDLFDVFAEILKYVYSITGRTVDLSQIEAEEPEGISR